MFGHRTTRRYLRFDALYYQHDMFETNTRELVTQSTISALSLGILTSPTKKVSYSDYHVLPYYACFSGEGKTVRLLSK